jgi:hypothetical protein
VAVLALCFATLTLRPAAADRAYLDRFHKDAHDALRIHRDDGPVVLRRYGKPDADDSTAHDDPRPPLVTRWMDYRKAGVRVLLGANESMRGPPPYTWLLIGFVDIASDQAISFEKGDARLKAAKH